MSDTCCFKLDFEPTTDKIDEFTSFLNSIYSMQFSCDEDLQITYGIFCDTSITQFYMVCDKSFETVLKNKLSLINPLMEFENMEDPLIECKNKNYKIDAYSMKSITKEKNKKSEADRNFMQNIFSGMKPIDNNKCIVEITIKPKKSKNLDDLKKVTLRKCTKSVINTVFKGASIIIDEAFDTGLNKMYETREIPDEDKKVENEIESNIRFYMNVKVISASVKREDNNGILSGMASAFSNVQSIGMFIPLRLNNYDIMRRYCRKEREFTSQQIAQIMHFPNKDQVITNLNNVGLKKLYDKDIPDEGILFGTLNGTKLAFPGVKIEPKTYKEHYKEIHSIIDNICKPRLILGQQGTGKSEWLINYVISTCKCGIGSITIDPKQDTQQRLIESLPEELLPKLVYINLGDVVYPPAFNIFKKRKHNDPTENSMIVSSFMSLMKKESRQWGYKMERACKMTADAILLLEKATLNEFLLMLTKKNYRDYLIEYMENLLNDEKTKGRSHIKKVLEYWQQMNEIDEKVLYKEFEPVLNIIGPFVGDRIVSAIVSQYDSFDFRKAADEGKIVIINIPEGTLRDNTRLLSSMINKSIWLDIQSRNDVDISERYPVSLVIDEAHEIVDDEFVSILTKARAYRLGLTLVTQGLSNFRMRGMDDVKELINTNCKNKIVFRVGYADARDMQEEFYPLSAYDLNNCPDYHFYAKILLIGKVSSTFAGKPLPCALKLRSYDDYIKVHRSGKFTIDEIEDQIENRLDAINVYFSLKNI